MSGSVRLGNLRGLRLVLGPDLVDGRRVGPAALQPVLRDDCQPGLVDDRANAVLAAAGYNFSLLIRWFEDLLRALITTILGNPKATQIALKSADADSSQTTNQLSDFL